MIWARSCSPAMTAPTSPGISANSRRNMLWITSMSLRSKCGCSSGFARELIINLLRFAARIVRGINSGNSHRNSVEGDLVLVLGQPGVERLEFGVELTHQVEVAHAGEVFGCVGIELEHVGDLDGTGLSGCPHLIGGQRSVVDLFAQRCGEHHGELLPGGVGAGDADGLVDELPAATKHPECGLANVLTRDERKLVA